METVRYTVREIRDAGALTRADHQRLFEFWQQHHTGASVAAMEALSREDIAPFADHIVLLRRIAPHEYIYVHYGDALVEVTGMQLVGERISLTGSSVELMRPGVSNIYVQLYERCLRDGSPLLSLNQAILNTRVHSWERLMLPFGCLNDPDAHVLGIVRPQFYRHEVLQNVSAIARFGSATLEPVHDTAGHVVDFAMIEATALAPVLGGSAPLLLSELLGEVPSETLMRALTSSAPGSSIDKRTKVIKGVEGTRSVQVEIFSAPVRAILTVHDVTAEADARHALEASRRLLQASEERFRDFAESGSDWFWQTDENHRFANFSADVAFGSGYRVNQNLNKTRREINLVPEDRPLIEAHMRDLEQRREFRDLVYRAYTDDGSIVAIRVSGRPFYDADGRFLGYRGSGSNVTEEMRRRAQLTENRTALERAEELANIGHWRWKARTGDVAWSQALRRLFGVEAAGRAPDVRAIAERVHPDDKAEFVRSFNAVLVEPAIQRFEARIQRLDGQWRHALFLVEGVHDAKGVVEVFGVARDVTDHVETMALVARRTEALAEANQLGRIGHWSYDFVTETVSWSDELYDLLGQDKTTLSHDRNELLKLYVEDDEKKLLAAQGDVLRTGIVASVDVRIRRSDGSIGDFVVTSKVDRDALGNVVGLRGTLQDISERKAAERRLEQLAFFDPLTGLANRALFQHRLTAALAEGKDMALLLLDLDGFKEVNDSFGHPIGDELLVRVGSILSGLLREGDFLARLGGDEFAVIRCEAEGTEPMAALAVRVVSALATPIALSSGEALIGASVGIAVGPAHGSTADELMRNADLALYRAKDDGRGRVQIFEPRLGAALQERTALARDLRKALEGKELEARYQPQVELSSERVVGFEALLRWKHPERGYVTPTEFIPVAENSTLIVDIGAWILHEACAQAYAWSAASSRAREVSVNVSAVQMWHGGFENDVARALEVIGLDPSLLTLEVTESVFVDHGHATVLKTLQALERLGVGLALDDFGTGYSSLSYLHRLPFKKLKIDRSFVSGIETSPEKRKLLSGIVALGRGLGMTTVAEGAETVGELVILRDMGCDVVQGYVFARPVPAEEATGVAMRIERRPFSAPLRLSRVRRA